MEAPSAKMLPFAGEAAHQEAGAWITAYTQDVLAAKDGATIEAYTRILKRFAEWLALRPGNSGQFHPQAITHTAIECFLDTLPSFSYKKQARAALSGFCRWLQEDHQLLDRNPAHGVGLPAQVLLVPRELPEDQRYVVRDLVEREADLRGKAAFALGDFAGCRVSDVSWLLLDALHVTTKAGWMTVGHKGGKERTIDLVNEARRELYNYLEQGERKESAYVFTSQREKSHPSSGEVDGWRWTEDGIHQWWQQLQARARLAEATFINDIDFRDLRHDFAHQARECDWSLEEVAYYLGHITKSGMPIIQTTIRYTQVSCEHVKEKLKLLRG